MGGVTQAVRTLALAALASWVLALSCADGDTGSSTGRSPPPRVSARAVAGEGGGGAGAGSAPGGGAEDQHPPSASGAPAHVFVDGGAGGQEGPGFLPVEGGGGEPPSCGGRSGAVCGANMTPASDPAMRYFCAGGDLVAQARCPGVCITKSNACGMGSGTGDGTDETPLGVWLHCRECLSVDCKAPLVACEADPWCAAHMDCKESCTVDEPCLSACRAAFAEDALMDDLNLCAARTECSPACARN